MTCMCNRSKIGKGRAKSGDFPPTQYLVKQGNRLSRQVKGFFFHLFLVLPPPPSPPSGGWVQLFLVLPHPASQWGVNERDKVIRFLSPNFFHNSALSGPLIDKKFSSTYHQLSFGSKVRIYYSTGLLTLRSFAFTVSSYNHIFRAWLC